MTLLKLEKMVYILAMEAIIYWAFATSSSASPLFRLFPAGCRQ
jgi:hypothetical protein